MEKYIIKLLILFTVLVFFNSCNIIVPYQRVMRSNYEYSSGEYQKALLGYLQVQENPQYAAHVQYNLGNLYAALGEVQSALRMWRLAENNSDVDIQFAVSFNRGVLYYEQGMYKEAYEEFKQALIVHPTDIDAKINLEHAYTKVEAENQLVQQPKPHEADDESSPESIRMIEYIKRKEQQQWKLKKGGEQLLLEDTQDW